MGGVGETNWLNVRSDIGYLFRAKQRALFEVRRWIQLDSPLIF